MLIKQDCHQKNNQKVSIETWWLTSSSTSKPVAYRAIDVVSLIKDV